jgi:hypothetical protein
MRIPAPIPEQLVELIKESLNVKEVIFVDDVQDILKRETEASKKIRAKKGSSHETA